MKKIILLMVLAATVASCTKEEPVQKYPAPPGAQHKKREVGR